MKTFKDFHVLIKIMKYTFLSLLFLAASSAVHGFSNLPGVSKPLGFFDPLGFSKGKTTTEFKKLQEAEIKHARVAMLASLGLIAQKTFHPLFGLQDADIGLPIYHYQIIADKAPLFTPILLSIIGAVEVATIMKGWKKQSSPLGIADLEDDYIPGDLGLDPYDVRSNPETYKIATTKELNNGRLAMIATVILVLQQLHA